MLSSWRRTSRSTTSRALVSATIHGAPTPFDKPQIPSAWSASVGRAQTPGAPATWSLANLDSDAQLKRSASLSSQKLDFAPMPYVGTPHEYLNYTRLAYRHDKCRAPTPGAASRIFVK